MAFPILAQENSNTKKLSRKEKKELRKKEKEAKIKRLSHTIESKRFVFEADQIMDRNAKTYPVISNINFVSIDSNIAVFQLGSASIVGVNGLGGVTIEGKIVNFKLNKNEKNGYYYIVLKVSTKFGFYDMQLDISPLGSTRVKITTSNHRKIGYSGVVKSFEDSNIYQGMTY